jgi:hypothetical protein
LKLLVLNRHALKSETLQQASPTCMFQNSAHTLCLLWCTKACQNYQVNRPSILTSTNCLDHTISFEENFKRLLRFQVARLVPLQLQAVVSTPLYSPAFPTFTHGRNALSFPFNAGFNSGKCRTSTLPMVSSCTHFKPSFV